MIASKIIEQLGGNSFLIMTGAKNLAGGENYVSFKIGRNRKNITHIKISLNSSTDLYDCTFYSIRGFKSSEHTIYNIPVENLKSTFTEKTGLATAL